MSDRRNKNKAEKGDHAFQQDLRQSSGQVQDELFKEISGLLSKAAEIIHIDTESEEVMKEKSTINLNYLRELSGGNSLFERTMLEIFVSKATSDVELLGISLEQNDFNGVKEQTNELISSLPIAGLVCIESVLMEIFTDANEKNITSNTIINYEIIKTHISEGVLEIKRMISEYDK